MRLTSLPLAPPQEPQPNMNFSFNIIDEAGATGATGSNGATDDNTQATIGSRRIAESLFDTNPKKKPCHDATPTQDAALTQDAAPALIPRLGDAVAQDTDANTRRR